MSKTIFKIALCITSLAIVSCGGKSDDVRDSARESLGVNETTPATPTSATATPGSTPTAVAAGGVQHYICPKNCAGSGGPSAGTCPVCGSEYVHNQAYHSAQQTPTTSTTGGVTTATFPGNTGATQPTQVTPPTPEPAQNAAGVWHYTCAKGCAGGGGTAGTCATCGGPLTHNTAYHQ